MRFVGSLPDPHGGEPWTCVAVRGGNDEQGSGLLVLLPPAASLTPDLQALAGFAASAVALAATASRSRHRIARQATHDPLTDLPGRLLFNDRIAHALLRREEQGVALLLVDVDRFATINQVWGQAVGDDVLVVTAARLRAALRPEDVLARLDGDRFGVLVTPVPGDGGMAVATRVHQALEGPVSLPAGPVPVRVSIGLAVGESADDTATTLVTVAAEALAAAKADGGGRVAMLGPAAREALMQQRRVEAELPGAIDRGEFCWYYQPLIELGTGMVTGFEALLRWRHPDRGVLPPGAFLDAVLRGGLMPALGRQMLPLACRQLVEWSARTPQLAHTEVAVNVSAPELQDPAFLDVVHAALRESGLPAERLVVEITETSLIADDGAEVVAKLAALRELGVRLALDDFGTGYSSLSHLRTFPVQILKLDRSFVSGGEDAVEDARLAPGIIQLARGLGLEVVAEGIETADQAELMTGYGAQIGQGYFISRPLPPSEIEPFVMAGAAALAGVSGAAAGSPASARNLSSKDLRR